MKFGTHVGQVPVEVHGCIVVSVSETLKVFEPLSTLNIVLVDRIIRGFHLRPTEDAAPYTLTLPLT